MVSIQKKTADAQIFCARERLHKEVASPFGFVASQIDRIVGKINHIEGLQNETALHR